MGSVQKIGEDYFIEFYARGLKYQQKIGPDEGEARKALDTIEAKIAKGEAAAIVRDVDHDIFFADFLKFSESQHPPATLKRYRSTVEDFTQFLRRECPAATKLSQVTPRVIELYKSNLSQRRSTGGKTLKPKTINLTLFLLRDVLEYAIKLGYLNDNPTVHIKLVKIPGAKVPTVLNEEETRQVFGASDSYLWFFIEFQLLTGVRPQEILNAHWTDIDWVNQIMKVRTENNASRDVAVNGRSLDILKQLQNKKYKSADYIFTDQSGHTLEIPKLIETLSRVTAQCGFKKTVGFAVFRHTFCRNLIKKGVGAAMLYKILGFKDIARCMVYAHFMADYWERGIYKAQTE